MKKNLICLILLIFLFGCKAPLTKYPVKPEPPQWFTELSSGDYIITGAGSGQSFAEARSFAFSELSGQISSLVEEEIDIIRKKNKSTVASFAEQQISLSSKNQITGAKLYRKETVNGIYYAAYKLDLRPPYIVLAEKIKKTFEKNNSEIPYNIKFNSSPVINSSYTAQQLKKIFKGFGGKGEKELDLSLERRTGSWFLRAGTDFVIIPEIFMVTDFSAVESKGFEISVVNNKGDIVFDNRLKKGDLFRLRIDAKDNIKGFVSLFNLYSDGRTALLCENIKIDKKNLTYPDPEKSSSVFEAGLIKNGHAVLDYYIAVYSDKPLNLIEFKKITKASFVKGKKSYAAHRLISFLQNSKVRYVSSAAVQTVP